MAIRSLDTKTSYVVTGNPDTVNESSPYMPGQPGQVLAHAQGKYQYVQMDSGATATAAIAPTANQVAFWKDSSQYIVTNDLRFSEGGRNTPAGIIRGSVTPGYYCFVLQKAKGILVKSSAGSANDTIIANSGTAADATNVAAGTASTYKPLGIAIAGTSGGNISTDIDIPSAE